MARRVVTHGAGEDEVIDPIGVGLIAGQAVGAALTPTLLRACRGLQVHALTRMSCTASCKMPDSAQLSCVVECWASCVE